jgi:hypothetical protein
MLRLRTSPLLAALLALVVLSAPALAGDPECKSTQAANDLRSCCYCSGIKTVLSDPEFEGIGFEVTPMKMGATVRMEAEQTEAQLLLQDFTRHMWGSVELDGSEQVCDYCLKRRENLDHVTVDWSATDDGVQLVLLSEKPKFAR